jgi:predicted acylesterase/phospholipase RssA
MTTGELCRIFMGQKHASLRFEPADFLRPAYREYLHRAARLPGILGDSLLAMLRHPSHVGISRLVSELGKAIPSGIFDNETIHDFLEHALKITGQSNRFEDLACKLYIIAVDLDSGAVVRFGGENQTDITISRAVQASAALPGLYPPVEIDGHHYVDGALRRTLHASAALNEGVDMLIGVNPLVPFDSGKNGQKQEVSAQKLTLGGLPLIMSQTFRALIQSRMEAGFRKYHRSYPDADLMLLEPDRDDEAIFFTNVFRYSDRKALCEHAYQATRRDLLARRAQLEPLLEKRDMALRVDMLEDTGHNLEASISRGPSSHAPVARNLAATLDKLDALIEAQ